MSAGNYSVLIGGKPWANADKADLITVSRTLNAAAVAEVHIGGYSPGVGWDLDIPKVGAALALKISEGTEKPASVFVGEVVGLEVFGSGSSRRLVVRAMDRARDLMFGPEPSVHANLSYAGVIKKLASGMSTSTHRSLDSTQDYLAVTGTAMEFIDDVCHRFGLSWWVDTAGKKLHVDRVDVNGTSTHHKVDVVAIEGRIDASATPSKVTVAGWDAAEQKPTTDNDSAEDLAKKMGNPSRIVGSPVLDAKEAKSVASGVASRASRAVESATVNIGFLGKLELGDSVELDETYGVVSAKQRVTGFEHRLSPGDVGTIIELGGPEERELADLIGDRGTGDPWATNGPVIGVVSNNGDPEKLGRVKVKFPVLDGNFETGWARVLTLRAGKKAGFRATPAMNDEVLVVFEQGDARRPIVLGGLFNKKNQPMPASGKDPSVETEIVTGDKVVTLLMSALDGKEQTRLETKGGKTDVSFVQNDKGVTIEAGKGDVVLKTAGGSITLKANGDITLEGKNVTIKAKGDVSLDGMNVNAKGKTGAKLEGTQVSVKASGKGEVSSSGILQVKGSLTQIG